MDNTPKFQFPEFPEFPQKFPGSLGMPRKDFNWQEMVDSILSFIATSRTTLKLLTQKLNQYECQKILEEQRIEDENVRLQFYRDCLKMDTVPNFNNVGDKIIQNPSADQPKPIKTEEKNEEKKKVKDPAEKAMEDMKRRSSYLAGLPRSRYLSPKKENREYDDMFFEITGSFPDRTDKKSRELGYRDLYKNKMLHSKGDYLSYRF